MTLAPENRTDVKERIVVRGACPHDCPDTCAMLDHVEDGRLVDVKGDPDHPMTNGGLCVKLRNFPGDPLRHADPVEQRREPLHIVSPKPHAFLNSHYGNASDKQAVRKEQSVVLFPSDAAARGVIEGDAVSVFNDRGSTVNSITADRHSGLGNAGLYSDNLVQVGRVPTEHRPTIHATRPAPAHVG